MLASTVFQTTLFNLLQVLERMEAMGPAVEAMETKETKKTKKRLGELKTSILLSYGYEDHGIK
jgi:hypothetical protein